MCVKGGAWWCGQRWRRNENSWSRFFLTWPVRSFLVGTSRRGDRSCCAVDTSLSWLASMLAFPSDTAWESMLHLGELTTAKLACGLAAVSPALDNGSKRRWGTYTTARTVHRSID
jgi:hypothetical protein